MHVGHAVVEHAVLVHPGHDVVKLGRPGHELEQRDLEQDELGLSEHLRRAREHVELAALDVDLEHVRTVQPALSHHVI